MRRYRASILLMSSIKFELIIKRVGIDAERISIGALNLILTFNILRTLYHLKCIWVAHPRKLSHYNTTKGVHAACGVHRMWREVNVSRCGLLFRWHVLCTWHSMYATRENQMNTDRMLLRQNTIDYTQISMVLLSIPLEMLIPNNNNFHRNGKKMWWDMSFTDATN